MKNWEKMKILLTVVKLMEKTEIKLINKSQ